MTFQYSDDKNFLTPVTDRDGQPLLTWQTIGVVSLTRDHLESAAPLAAVLQPFDAHDHRRVDHRPVQRDTGRRRDRDQTPRPGRLAAVADQLKQIPGVAVADQGALLTANRDLSSPAIDGLQALWQKAIDAAAGWSVRSRRRQGPADRGAGLDAAARHRADPHHARHPAAAARPAGRRHRDRGPRCWWPSRPRPAASSPQPRTPPPTPRGRSRSPASYPPGSTFKTITTAAAMQAGLATPDTPEACPGTRHHREPDHPQRGRVRPGHRAAVDGVLALVQHDDGRAGRQAARRRAAEHGAAVRDWRRLRHSRPDHHHRQRAQRRHPGAEGRERDRTGHRHGEPVRPGRRRGQPRARFDDHPDPRRRRDDDRQHPVRTDPTRDRRTTCGR